MPTTEWLNKYEAIKDKLTCKDDLEAHFTEKVIGNMAVDVLDIGAVHFPTGQIFACDPLVELEDTLPFLQTIPAGTYPVKICVVPSEQYGEVRQVHEASAELSRLPILIDDHPMTSMDRVRSSARLLKSKNRCDMVIVDYLQLCDMRSDQKNRNREQEVAQASRKAKLLAKELDIPVLLLSQLNRASDGTIDHRPTLSNLRESGAIEQDADMVMLLCRPALYGKTVDKKSTYPTDGLGIVIIAKHRNGKTGEVYFHHNQSMTKLVDYIPPLEWLTRNAK